VFRAAPLRNIAVTAPYFHSGKVWDLKVAVEIMAESQLGEALTDEEATQIAAFLGTLTGKLPPITTPVLPAETAATPRPTAEVVQ
jgi:cytochrome c peroxidase